MQDCVVYLNSILKMTKSPVVYRHNYHMNTLLAETLRFECTKGMHLEPYETSSGTTAKNVISSILSSKILIGIVSSSFSILLVPFMAEWKRRMTHSVYFHFLSVQNDYSKPEFKPGNVFGLLPVEVIKEKIPLVRFDGSVHVLLHKEMR